MRPEKPAVLRLICWLAALSAASQLPAQQLWDSKGLPVYDLSVNPERTLVAAVHGPAIHLHSLEGEGGSTVRDYPQAHQGRALAVEFAPEGQHFASGGQDSTVALWAQNQPKALRRWRLPGMVLCLRFSPDGRWIAAGLSNAQACLISLPTGELQMLDLPGTDAVISVDFHPDGSQMLAASKRWLSRWSLPDLRMLEERSSYQSKIFSAAFMPDSASVALASRRKVRIYDFGQQRSSQQYINGQQVLLALEARLPGALVSGGMAGRIQSDFANVTYYAYLPAAVFDCAIWESSQSGVYELLAATNGKGLWRISTLDMELGREHAP